MRKRLHRAAVSVGVYFAVVGLFYFAFGDSLIFNNVVFVGGVITIFFVALHLLGYDSATQC